jgi:putative ABC transport system permease protein
VVSSFTYDGKESGNGGIPTPLVKAAGEVAGVELAVPVFDRYFTNVTVPGLGDGEPRVFEEEIRQIVETDGRYFQITSYDWLAGSPVAALDAPDKVVLTRSRAARYFPGLSPEQVLGQTLFYSDTMRTTVTGVVADLEYPSVFEAKEMRSFSKPIVEGQTPLGQREFQQPTFSLARPKGRA